MNTVMVPILLAFPAAIAGLGAGFLHFSSLRKVADLIVAGKVWAIVLQVLRMVALGLFLYLCALAGATTLLAAAGGVIAGRLLVQSLGKS